MKKKLIFCILTTALLLSTPINGAASTSPAPSGAGTAEFPVLFGAYPSADLQSSIDDLTRMDSWLENNGASGVTFAADFISITFNPGWNVEHELEAAWSNNFIPFINLMPSASWEGSYYQENCDTSEDIAQGKCDSYLQTWADYYKSWAGDSKRAFIAPLPEANGNWANYSTDGTTFIQAFTRIQDIFENVGVPQDAVHWVFAPNGWHDPETPQTTFENYYPGDDNVDIVAFSSYNYGGCPYQWASWATFDEGFKPFLERMRDLAPTKPIFIAQTGTVDVPVDPGDPNQTKSAWVSEVFDVLANYPAVKGILYFNKIGDPVGRCADPDFRLFYDPDGEASFLEIMSDSRFGRWDVDDARWDQINNSAPPPVEPTFEDVPVYHWAFDYIEALYDGGYTAGCSTDPLLYCPDMILNRGMSAVFLLRGEFGTSYQPPPAPWDTFADDWTDISWAEPYAEGMWEEGLTAGCWEDPLKYCPTHNLTKAEASVFGLRMMHGVGYTPPDATGTLFADMTDPNSWKTPYAEQAYRDGLLPACGEEGGKPLFCPDEKLNRAWGAYLIVQAKGLPLPTP